MNPVKVFESLGDPLRLRIVHLLLENEPIELCACTIFAVLDISRALFSHHIHILENAGIVKIRKYGRWKFYHFNDDVKLIRLLRDVIEDAVLDDPIYAEDARRMLAFFKTDDGIACRELMERSKRTQKTFTTVP